MSKNKSNREWVYVPRLPRLKKDPVWDTCFDLLQTPHYQPYRKLLPCEQLSLECREGRWLIVFHWVIKKKWLSKHKIPTRQKKYEPEGEFWFWILELCLQLHSTKWGKPYENAADWFSWIVYERRLPDWEALFPELKQSNSDEKPIGRITKTKFKENEQLISGDLRQGKNPWHPEFNPHHYSIISAALEMSEYSDRFHNQFWKKFLAAYSGWIKSLAHFNFVFLKNNQLVMQEGRGQFTSVLPLPSDLIPLSPPQLTPNIAFTP
ncbi:MAG: hypothetical protein QNJ53_20985 [Pleurocapsa sp. MO_192.B19]|nr:hypothetical protein [Pleurocapsa sp. MO_192.B19]